jgi:hypothetical protein
VVELVGNEKNREKSSSVVSKRVVLLGVKTLAFLTKYAPDLKWSYKWMAWKREEHEDKNDRPSVRPYKPSPKKASMSRNQWPCQSLARRTNGQNQEEKEALPAISLPGLRCLHFDNEAEGQFLQEHVSEEEKKVNPKVFRS